MESNDKNEGSEKFDNSLLNQVFVDSSEIRNIGTGLLHGYIGEILVDLKIEKSELQLTQ